MALDIAGGIILAVAFFACLPYVLILLFKIYQARFVLVGTALLAMVIWAVFTWPMDAAVIAALVVVVSAPFLLLEKMRDRRRRAKASKPPADDAT